MNNETRKKVEDKLESFYKELTKTHAQFWIMKRVRGIQSLLQNEQEGNNAR